MKIATLQYNRSDLTARLHEQVSDLIIIDASVQSKRYLKGENYIINNVNWTTNTNKGFQILKNKYKCDWAIMCNNDIILNDDINLIFEILDENFKKNDKLAIQSIAFNSNHSVNQQHNSGGIRITPYIEGTFMGVNYKFIEKCGYMNENYGWWASDIEWCVRARQAGWQVGVDDRVSFFHETSVSMKSETHFQNHLKKMQYDLHLYFKRIGPNFRDIITPPEMGYSLPF